MMACCSYCNGTLMEVYECSLCHKLFCSLHEAPYSHDCEAVEIKVAARTEKGEEEHKKEEEP